MRSYIKLYGPPILKALAELAKLAVDMPEVCIMDTILATIPDPTATGASYDHLTGVTAGRITKEQCDKIVSRYSEMLGDYDFFFEWFKDPSPDECRQLIEKIDAALAPTGCRYSITTKR